MVQIIDGRATAARLKLFLKSFIARQNLSPKLSIIRVGDHEPSRIYVKAKLRDADALGIAAEEQHLPENVTLDTLEQIIHLKNRDATIDGMIIQLPLPEHLPQDDVLNMINPLKDADGLVGPMTSCTPLGCMWLLRSTGITLKGKRAVVVGRSRLVGNPMAELLKEAGCLVETIDKGTRDPKTITRTADILVVAAGAPKLIKKDWIKPGVIIIDVGITRMADGTVSGDVDFEAVKDIADAITPVPGGVGPMTRICLLYNLVMLNLMHANNQTGIAELKQFIKDQGWDYE
jgi:methylenetetrahydrofolate dehydrogenase (NADP+)/methenyltetrahydrofolate cyclohydrolase